MFFDNLKPQRQRLLDEIYMTVKFLQYYTMIIHT